MMLAAPGGGTSRDAAKAPTGPRTEGDGSPVGEGVPGQVQVGEVGAAASQQGAEQLETKQEVLRD